ncbi:DUF2268 domain-containing putative Zn-dependent protease [Chryseobacterium sp. MYb264]|uniref:DUF2268 domain-containing putative Zn-dependent protease n=1 Tax=Chryseobacterium sp. MYb264 TaxID=2745153 RepID=UPI002E144B3A|nr:DUF2268 domain-containing putative Zn-dependent protease [Chryseobacterium sp. MYb264]WSO31447.1 DUF2268 domain-containing putative Zn-dependent protease [Chryseobacterium sp. MYb264]
MKRSILYIMTIAAVCFSSMNQKLSPENTFETNIEKLADSIKVNDIVVKNLFKYQILAHQNNTFDAEMITKKVYQPHKKLWDSCYGSIFGDENAGKFNNAEGMIEWNKTLYPKNKILFEERAQSLLNINLNKVLKTNLKKFSQLVPYQPKATISILYSPLTGIGFGGCNADQFALELNYENTDPEYMIEKGLPHELNHLVYEKFRTQDAHKNSALSQTIDEGFACYFTWVFFEGKIQKYEAVENMSKKDWEWFLKNEKKIFVNTKKFFDDESGNNPLLRNDKLKLFPDAPKTLNYWLGFRIVQKYVDKHGADSWKDIYQLNSKEVLEKSGYEEFINSL